MDTKKHWTEEDNNTLTELHKKSKYYKELYKRVSTFYLYIYKMLGTLSITSSSLSTCLFFIDNEKKDILNTPNNTIINYNGDNETLIKSLLITMLVSTLLQNMVNFIGISIDYLNTSEMYMKIQFKIEAIGDIHPARRKGKPKRLLPHIRDATNKLSQDSNDINGCLKRIFHNQNKVISYMGDKHKNYELEDLSEEEYTDEYNNFHIDDIDLIDDWK